MTHKLLIILTSIGLIAACTTVKSLPDPRANCPTIPGELMKAPERPHPIENSG